MPIPKQAYEELIAKHEHSHREAKRVTLWDFVRTCVTMIACVLVGWVFIGFSVHTTNPRIAYALYWGGLCIWIPGVLFPLLAAYRRGEQRGDW